MAEPSAMLAAEQDGGKMFTNARLRERIGPGNPIYHLLSQLIVRDVAVLLKDEFTGVLNTDVWTSTENGSGTPAALRTGVVNGEIRMVPGTTDNNDSRLVGQTTYVDSAFRPAFLARLNVDDITTVKWEAGFIDAAAAGAVLVKATPTSTATDYAVVVRDTDDDTSIDLHSDGTTDAVGSIASSGSAPTAANGIHNVFLLTVNEQTECRFWLDGGFAGVVRSGPDTGTLLTPWFYVQIRAGGAITRNLDIDFVQVWQDRTTNA